MGRGTNQAVQARRARDGRQLTDDVAVAAHAEQVAAVAQDVRAAWAELQAAQELGDPVMVGRLTGQLGMLVTGLRAAGVSTAGIAELVEAPPALVRAWLRAAGGGR